MTVHIEGGGALPVPERIETLNTHRHNPRCAVALAAEWEEWNWWFEKTGYNGDFSFIYFQ